jgi:hypothetical protein
MIDGLSAKWVPSPVSAKEACFCAPAATQTPEVAHDALDEFIFHSVCWCKVVEDFLLELPIDAFVFVRQENLGCPQSMCQRVTLRR